MHACLCVCVCVCVCVYVSFQRCLIMCCLSVPLPNAFNIPQWSLYLHKAPPLPLRMHRHDSPLTQCSPVSHPPFAWQLPWWPSLRHGDSSGKLPGRVERGKQHLGMWEKMMAGREEDCWYKEKRVEEALKEMSWRLVQVRRGRWRRWERDSAWVCVCVCVCVCVL